MYIIELITKLFLKKKQQLPFADINEKEPDSDLNCSHIFLPIDSTGKYLACSKCGLVIKSDVLNDVSVSDPPFDNN